MELNYERGKMRLLIDMDGVAAALLPKWLEIYNTTYNDSLTLEQITTNYEAPPHILKCSIEDYRKITNAPGFFASLEVIPYAIEVSQRLQQHHELIFVTATP